MFFNISCGEIKHVYLFSQEAVRPLLTPNEECSNNPLGTSLLKSPNKRVNPLLIWRAEESARLRNTPVWLTQQGSLYSYFLASNCPPVRASDFYLSRAHTVRFLIVFCDCCLSHCTNMIPMSNCRISVVLMSDCTTVKTRQKRTYSRKTCPEFYVINPWPAFSRYNGS